MAFDPDIKQWFTQAQELLILHSTRAALKQPFLGKTPQIPRDDDDLPSGSELKAYQDERELRDGLTARLQKALRGHGLFATQRLAIALGKVWASLTERNEGASFVLWMDHECGILLALTELELMQIGRLRDKSRQARAAQIAPGGQKPTQPLHGSGSLAAQQVHAARQQQPLAPTPLQTGKSAGKPGTVTHHPSFNKPMPPAKG